MTTKLAPTRSLLPWPMRPLVCLLTALPFATAGAQVQLAAAELQTVTVTATRTEKQIEDLPPSVTTTDRATLDENFVDDYQDLGKQVPGVDISRSGRYGYTDINIRGLQGNRVLTLIDGIRLPDTFEFQGRDSRVGQDLVDFGSLSSVDIVRGPGSTLYGSSALAGIVGLRTLDPSDLLTGNKTLGGRVKGDYDGADNSKGVQAALAGRFAEDTLWLVQLGERRGHELDTGGSISTPDNRRTQSDPQDTTRRSIMAKLQQRFDGGHKLGLTAEYFKTDIDTDLLSLQAPAGNTAAARVLNSTARDEQERRRVSLEYDYRAPGAGSFLDAASARIYHQKLESDQFRREVRANAPRYERDGQYEQSLKGFSGQLSKRIAGSSISQNWVIGGEWWETETDEFAAGFPNIAAINVRTVPKTRNKQWGVFADNELSFGGGAFTLTPGLRYDSYSIKPEVDSILAGQIASGSGSRPATQSDSRLSPKIAANWALSDRAHLFAQYAHGFRAPGLVEVNGQFTNTRMYTLIPNAALKPETSRGLEFGARLGDQQLGGTVTVFDTRYKNFIEMSTLTAGSPGFVPGYGSVFQYNNVAAARIYGTEFTGHYQIARNWRAEGMLAWMQGKNDTTNTWINSVPSAKASLALRYSEDKWGAMGRLTVARAKDKTASPTTFAAPGYGVVDLTAWWVPVKDVRVSVGVFNLFDQKYWNGVDSLTTAQAANSSTLDFYSLPGRNLRASVAWQF
ncbi:TonB-dependent hemoglobin/transferrin/lactoferrin family receptor [Pigmentiphaga aceris]|nr:TonB-dependent hemoglobin/transferrin/lactoferrin family receptor [Pigmentiphaga aceris]